MTRFKGVKVNGRKYVMSGLDWSNPVQYFGREGTEEFQLECVDVLPIFKRSDKDTLDKSVYVQGDWFVQIMTQNAFSDNQMPRCTFHEKVRFLRLVFFVLCRCCPVNAL